MTATMIDQDTPGPTTWEEACNEALTAVLAPADDWTITDLDQIERNMTVCLNGAKANLHFGDVAGMHPSSELLAGVARYAWQWMKADGYDLPTYKWMVEKLAEKQANYGTGNILAFGVTGLVVRSSDKVSRVSNMRAKGRTSVVESLFDSLFDLIGYAVIGIMLDKGTFELPLRRDTPEGQVVDEAEGIVRVWDAKEQDRIRRMNALIRRSVPNLDDETYDRILGEARQITDDPDDLAVVAAYPHVVIYRKDGKAVSRG